MSRKINLKISGGSQYNYFTASPHIEHLKTSPHSECKSVFQKVLLPQSTANLCSVFLTAVRQTMLDASDRKMNEI